MSWNTLEEAYKNLDLLVNDVITPIDKILHELYEGLTQTNEILKILSQSLTEVYNKPLREGKYSTAVEKIKEEALRIFIEEIQTAVLLNREFNHPFFKDRLIAAISIPGCIEIVQLTNKNISVKVNLNKYAGSLRDYGNAIKKVREKFPNITTPDMASHFWREKYYAAAREGISVPRRHKSKGPRGGRKITKEDITAQQIEKYWDNMTKRMEYSGKIAPFWEILDKGTVKLSSDRGGTPYPVNAVTGFVAKAINRIKLKFKEIVRESLEEQINIDVEYYRDLIEQYRLLYEAIKNAIKDISKIVPDPFMLLLLKNLEKRRISLERVSGTKLKDLVEALRTGNFEKVRVTAEGRTELTVKGQQRYRMGIKSILNTIGRINY